MFFFFSYQNYAYSQEPEDSLGINTYTIFEKEVNDSLQTIKKLIEETRSSVNQANEAIKKIASQNPISAEIVSEMNKLSLNQNSLSEANSALNLFSLFGVEQLSLNTDTKISDCFIKYIKLSHINTGEEVSKNLLTALIETSKDNSSIKDEIQIAKNNYDDVADILEELVIQGILDNAIIQELITLFDKLDFSFNSAESNSDLILSLLKDQLSKIEDINSSLLNLKKSIINDSKGCNFNFSKLPYKNTSNRALYYCIKSQSKNNLSGHYILTKGNGDHLVFPFTAINTDTSLNSTFAGATQKATILPQSEVTLTGVVSRFCVKRGDQHNERCYEISQSNSDKQTCTKTQSD